MSQTNWTKNLQGTLGVLIFLGILVAANLLLGGLRCRRDLTADQLYTLSAGSKKLLAQLPREVTLKFYFSRSLESPALLPVKQYAQRVEDLLREYARNSGGKVTVETYNPRPDSDEEEWAQRYGLTPQGLGALGEGGQLYLGVVAVAGAKEAALPFLSPDQEPQLEYQLTRLLYEVTQERKPKVGVLSSLPVMGQPGMPEGMMGMGGPQRGTPPWQFVTELKQTYEVELVNADTDALDTNLTAVVAIHPRELAPKALFALDQYVLRGGKLLVFEDPMSLTAQQNTPPQMQMMGGGAQTASDLNALTKAWGVELTPGKMVADFRAATGIRVSEDRTERLATWLTLRKENIDRAEVSTSSLDLLMLPFAGSFAVKPAEGLRATTLLHTSADAGEVAAAGSMFMPDATLEGLQKAHKVLPLAVRLQGKFKTAFPEGRPADPAATNAAPAAAPALTAATAEGVVILVGDVDMLADRFALQSDNILGQRVMQLANDNLNFALNMVEQLTGSSLLVGLRSRGGFERPFERVLALQAVAQERWREEELKLQQQLRDAQTRLSELQSSKDEGQKFILSAEQKAEIEKFRQQQFQARQQLKEVRKSFRQEIEALGLKLKVLNIAAIPLLVALFGILRGLRRRKG